MSVIEQAAYISATRNTLSRLQTGKKLWFWFCGANVEQSLFLSELSEDPTMASLTEKIRATEAPAGVNQYIGLLSVGRDGQLEFVSKKASLMMLYEVASYCKTQIQTIPELAVFRRSVMAEANDEGAIINRYSDSAAWKGIGPAPVLGTSAHGVSELISLQQGQTAWFALGKDGEGIRLVVNSVQNDPKGEGFAALLKSLSLNQPETLIGTVLRGEQRLIFTCAKGTGEDQALFSTLNAQYGAQTPLLKTLKLFRIKGSKKKEIALDLRSGEQASSSPAAPAQKSEAAQLLSGLTESDRLLFYFTDSGEGSSPILLLSKDKDALKTKAKGIAQGSRTLRGSCALTAKGFIVFQSTGKIEKFVSALAAWVTSQPNPKDYKALIGARFIQKTSDGIISKEKDDAAWAAIQ